MNLLLITSSSRIDVLPLNIFCSYQMIPCVIINKLAPKTDEKKVIIIKLKKTYTNVWSLKQF